MEWLLIASLVISLGSGDTVEVHKSTAAKVYACAVEHGTESPSNPPRLALVLHDQYETKLLALPQLTSNRLIIARQKGSEIILLVDDDLDGQLDIGKPTGHAEHLPFTRTATTLTSEADRVWWQDQYRDALVQFAKIPVCQTRSSPLATF